MKPMAPEKINSHAFAGSPVNLFFKTGFSKPSFSFRLNSDVNVYAASKKEMATKKPNDCIGRGMLIPKRSFSKSDMVGYTGGNYEL